MNARGVDDRSVLLLRLRSHTRPYWLGHEVDQVLRQRENILAVVVPVRHVTPTRPLQQVQQLQRLHDVLDGEGGHLRLTPARRRHLRDVDETEHLLVRLGQQLDQLCKSHTLSSLTLLPKAMVRNMPQIRQRLLGRAHFLLDLAQLVRELDHEVPVPLALVWRQRHNARQVVAQLAALLLAEVAHQVIALVIVLSHHIEIERRHIEVQRLVVQEQLRDVRDVLRVHALRVIAVPVHLEHRDVALTVDFVAWRALRLSRSVKGYEEGALLHVTVEFLVCEEETETVFADKQLAFRETATPTQSVWPVGYISFGKGLKYQLSIT